jgi:A/G-specific adenine glycosylase
VKKISPITIQNFNRTLRVFYKKNRRDLPWRNTTDPYHIVVSEIMLQQTQVPRVLVKYASWLKKFPNWRALASASLSEVLAEWKGLGYNRRGLALHKIAQILIAEKRPLPRTADALVALPAIGPNTAGSIMAFVYNEPTIFIETNVRTVFIHHFWKATSRRKPTDKEILKLVTATIDRKNPREWYYALMDYGTHLKKTVGNVSRRAAIYRPQTKFEGSNRQLRAALLFALQEKPRGEAWLVKNISHILQREVAQIAPLIRTNLATLSHEGFITQKGSLWRVQ